MTNALDTIRRAPAIVAVLGLALGALAGCASGDPPARTPQTPEETRPPSPGGSNPSQPPSPGGNDDPPGGRDDPSRSPSPGGNDDPPGGGPTMTITPDDEPPVTVKRDYRQGAGDATRGVVSVNVEGAAAAAGWRSEPLGSYFDFPDNARPGFAVGSRTGSIATATIRDSRLVVGAFASSGTVAVTATGAAGARATLTFRFAVGPEEPEEEPAGGSNGGGNRERNDAPAIVNPGDKSYTQREAIAAFDIAVSDPESDALTVGVSGLPGGLAYSQTTGRVSGTVAADAAAQAHTVTVTANDGVNDPVTATFTITVTANAAPQISAPAAQSPVYCTGCRWGDRGAAIVAFGIAVSDAESDSLTVTVSGLPMGLTYSQTTGMVSGTVNASAAVRLYTATVTANDGIGDATRDFNFRVLHRILLSAGNVVRSPFATAGSVSTVSAAAAQTSAQQSFNSSPPTGWTSALSATTSGNLANTAAAAACSGMTPSLQLIGASVFVGTFVWEYSADLDGDPNEWQYQARRRHPWAARCR